MTVLVVVASSMTVLIVVVSSMTVLVVVASFGLVASPVLVLRAVPIVVVALALLQDPLQLSSSSPMTALLAPMGAMILPKTVTTLLLLLVVPGPVPMTLVIKPHSVRLFALALCVPLVVAAIRTAIISQPQLLQNSLRQRQRPTVTVLVKSPVVRPALGVPMTAAALVPIAVAGVQMAVAVVPLALVPTRLVAVAGKVIIFLITVILLLLLLAPSMVIVVATTSMVIVATSSMVVVATSSVVVVATPSKVVVVAATASVVVVAVLLVALWAGLLHLLLEVGVVTEVRSSVLAVLVVALDVLLRALGIHGPAAVGVFVVAVGHLVHVPRIPAPIEQLHTETTIQQLTTSPVPFPTACIGSGSSPQSPPPSKF
jgi:hypothetical protein